MIKETFISYLSDSLKENWDMPAFTNYGIDKTLTYGDVATNVLDLHNFFSENKVEKGDKIALVGKNNINWALVYIATVSFEAVIVPILPDFAAENIANIVNHSESKYLFSDETIYKELERHEMKNIKAVFSLNNFEKIFQKDSEIKDIKLSHEQANKNSFSLKDIPNQTLATIIYTSGTTGFSKGVMISHNAISANLKFAIDNMGVTRGNKQLAFLPMAHVFGCLFDFLFPFSRGAHITFLSQLPTPQVLLKALAEVRPHLILAVPLILEKLYYKQVKPILDKPIMKILWRTPILSSLIKKKLCAKLTNAFGGRFYEFIVGGSALNESVEKFFKDIKFNLSVGYGMTECAPLIGYTSAKDHVFRSCGKIMTYLDIEIDSKDPYNEVGEIIVYGENVMMGYYNNKEATDEVLKDGKLRTGDLGVISKDKTIFIRGRSKNMLLGASGENIYPEEIESKYNSYPYVMESLILQRDDNLYALIYPDVERVKTEGIDKESLKEIFETTRKSINKFLPVSSAVNYIEIMEKEFEKNPTKKIKRFLYK